MLIRYISKYLITAITQEKNELLDQKTSNK